MAQLATFSTGTSSIPYMLFTLSYILQIYLKCYLPFKDKQKKPLTFVKHFCLL